MLLKLQPFDSPFDPLGLCTAFADSRMDKPRLGLKHSVTQSQASRSGTEKLASICVFPCQAFRPFHPLAGAIRNMILEPFPRHSGVRG